MKHILMTMVAVLLLTSISLDVHAQKKSKANTKANSNIELTDVPAGEKEVKWRSFEDVDRLMKLKPKPVLIDMYTDWCGWCKVMDKKTYSQQEVIDYINKNFYAVKFNAEQKDPVTFNGKTYTTKGKTHQLAIEMMQGRLSYPTTIVLESDLKTLSPIPGYLQPSQLEVVLKYLREGRDQGITWEAWQQEFKPTWPNSK